MTDLPMRSLIEDSFKRQITSFHVILMVYFERERGGDIMTTKKDLVIVILATFCLTLTLFTILPAGSNYKTSGIGEYDPWIDSNDDGRINILDCIILSGAFDTTGTPINKTALLLELQARIDSLNDSVLDLEAYLIARIASLETSLTTQQSKIASLNETIQLLETRIIDLEYNFSLLNPYVVSYNSTYNATGAGTTETLSWVDMPSTSVDISLNTTCYLLIMFSAESFNNNTNSNYVTYIQALVDSTVALPGSWISLTPSISESLGWPYAHRHSLDSYMACSYNFYEPSVPAGNHTVKIQWRVTGGTGCVLHRTLTVLALPAQ
jgi:hypothetical protein